MERDHLFSIPLISFTSALVSSSITGTSSKVYWFYIYLDINASFFVFKNFSHGVHSEHVFFATKHLTITMKMKVK